MGKSSAAGEQMPRVPTEPLEASIEVPLLSAAPEPEPEPKSKPEPEPESKPEPEGGSQRPELAASIEVPLPSAAPEPELPPQSEPEPDEPEPAGGSQPELALADDAPAAPEAQTNRGPADVEAGEGGNCLARNRWLCLAAGCGMQVCAGAVYSFGAIADDLKQNLELKDAFDQSMISIAGNLGLWAGSFTGGLLADARGPREVMLGGAALLFVGYGAVYLALSHRVDALREPLIVAFFYLLAGLGSGWVMNSAMFTNTQNWGPARRAKVVSILATLMGAAATIWSTLLTGCLGGHAELSRVVGSSSAREVATLAGGLAISAPQLSYGAELDGSGGGGQAPAAAYHCVGGWVNGDVVSFFGLLALALPAITLFGAWASFRMEDEEQRAQADADDGGDEAITRRLEQGVRALLAVLFTVGVCSVIVAMNDGEEAAVRVDQWSPVLMLLVLGLLGALLGSQRDLLVRCRCRTEDLGAAYAGVQGGSGAAQPAPAPAPAHTARTALHTREFWLVAGVMATVCGSNTVTINLISIIIDDRHVGTPQFARGMNVMLMTTSALFRILTGQLMAMAPDKPVHAWTVTMSALASVVGQALFAVDSTPLLFAAVVIVGVSDGFFWASLPIVCNSLFGLKNSGGIYGMLNCLGAVGFISLSLGVQPAVYSSNSSVGMMECDAGVLCFRGFHLVCLAYSVGGTCAALGLVRVVAKQRGSLASALLPAQPPRLSGSE